MNGLILTWTLGPWGTADILNTQSHTSFRWISGGHVQRWIPGVRRHSNWLHSKLGNNLQPNAFARVSLMFQFTHCIKPKCCWLLAKLLFTKCQSVCLMRWRLQHSGFSKDWDLEWEPELTGPKCRFQRHPQNVSRTGSTLNTVLATNVTPCSASQRATIIQGSDKVIPKLNLKPFLSCSKTSLREPSPSEHRRDEDAISWNITKRFG